MAVQLEFDFTFRDYLQAQRLHARRTWWTQLNDLMARRLSPLLGAMILLFGILISGPGVSWTAPFILMLFCGLLLLFYPFYMRARLKSCYKRTLVGDGRRALDLDENTIKGRESNICSEFQWAAVKSFQEGKEIVLLYIAPAKFIAIPKHACLPSQLDQIRDLCKALINIG
jgi:hypothetical protein